MTFHWSDGVRIGDTNLWCDARRCPAEATAFVSHARAPRLRGAADCRVVTTERTRLLRAVEITPRGQAAGILGPSGAAGGAERSGIIVTPFGRPFALGRLRLELLPSGHVPGAAQLYVELEEAGVRRRVAYCGPLNPQPGRFAEAPQVRAAEALCIDAPLAAHARKLPPRAEAEAQLVAAVERALDDGATPVVLAPALGGAQELVALLAAAALPVRVHARIAAWIDVYERIGLKVRAAQGEVRKFRGTPGRGEVVVWPLEDKNAAAIGRLRTARLFAATGAALEPDAAARLRVDAAFALSDHGDLPSLVAHARAAEARDVWLTGGFSDAAARAFAAGGIRAHALAARRPMQQLALFGE